MSQPEVREWNLPLKGFAVRVWEAGAGEPILCVHGGPGMSSGYFFPDPEVWGPGLRALAADHRVVAYDQRGCGGSGVPDVEQPLALSRHVDDVENVRVALGLERPIVLVIDDTNPRLADRAGLLAAPHSSSSSSARPVVTGTG